MNASETVRHLLEKRESVTPEEFLTASEDVINRFSSYMQGIDSIAAAPLSNPEKALIRTFLVALIREKI